MQTSPVPGETGIKAVRNRRKARLQPDRWLDALWERTLVSRLELILILVTLALGGSLGLVGLAASGHSVPLPLVGLVAGIFVYNLLLLILDHREVAERFVTWGARLGDLVFLTLGIKLTGSFSSPFFSLYGIYIVISSLRCGWRGTVRSLVLCAVAWVVLALLHPDFASVDHQWLAMLLSTFLVMGVVVGPLAQRFLRLRDEAVQRQREMAFLQEVSHALSASLDPQKVLAETLAQVNELLDVDAASLALLDPETGRIRFEWAIGGGNDDVKGLCLSPGQGIVGQVVSEGESILVPDVSADPRWYSGVDHESGFQTRSLLCVPLSTKGQIIGALEVLNKRDGPFTEQDRRLLTSLAGLAAQFIDNARLHEQILGDAQNLQVAYDQVRHLNELKSTFIRNLSHELRTPLALIQGYVELLLDGELGNLRPEQRQGLSVVADRSAHLNRMVNDIISLQAVGAMDMDLQNLDLESLARDAVEAILMRAQRARVTISVEHICPAEQLQVRGDARRLGQVFAHLLDNAIKFSPDGGCVQLRLGREGSMAIAQVRDEGIGLPPDKLAQVFDLFYQVDGSSTRRYGGLGLGLALVREVIGAHGGAVYVESEGVPGKGSTFTFLLPALKTVAGLEIQAEPLAINPATGYRPAP